MTENQNPTAAAAKSDDFSIPASRLRPGTEKTFLGILDCALDVGISVLNSDLQYEYLNAGMFEQLRIDPEDLSVGQPLGDAHALMLKNGLLNEEIMAQTQLSPAEQKARTEAQNYTSVMKLADGRTMELKRHKLANGYTVSISHDISDVVEKDKLLEDALYLGQSGYWIFDIKSKNITLSKTFLEYFGKERVAEIKKKGVGVIAIPEDRHVIPQAVKKALTADDKFVVEFRTQSASGSIRRNRTHGEILRDENGKPSKIRAFSKDITKEYQQAKELERAKDEALAASLAKSEFLANMSHEIRTPMNGILGMAELLANTSLNEMQREPVEVINKSAIALLTIINDILDFSKIEAGAFELDPVQFDLKESVNDISKLMTQQAHQKGIELIVNYHSDLPRYFIGDAGRICQVITNLVGNAIKFTSEGHVLIDIDVRDSKADTKIVKVKVKDTGIGIEEHKLKDVFSKFNQADNSTTRVYGGTGLGLTISKSIIEMMGGRISVKSKFGQGSTFVFAIPLPIDKATPNVTYDTSAMRRKKALIVDDIDINRNILSRHLKAWDMHAVCVEDGVKP